MIFLDQLNRKVNIPHLPQRIVSLVPSQTELLFDLGLADRVVGITKFCIHPDSWYRTKTRVGGTKDFKLKRIQALQPDLIIANKEENTKEGIEELSQYYPVWMSDVKDLASATGMIRGLGLILDKIDEAEEMVSQIHALRQEYTVLKPMKKCAYLIWKDPYMTIGGDTFISNMLEEAGFENVYKDLKRYPSVSLGDLLKSEAECILLSSEPFPFKEKHIKEIAEKTGKKVILVDGEMFSWYGSRLLKVWNYFKTLNEY